MEPANKEDHTLCVCDTDTLCLAATRGLAASVNVPPEKKR